MSILHPKHGPHPIHTVHRISAAVVGGFLTLFGVLGLSRGLAWLTPEGSAVMGLTTNGLLSVISVIVGVVLIGAAVRGGPAASTVSIVVAIGFLVSGVANAFLLGTAMNMLAFTLPNVMFSIAVGLALLILGSYGRISGGLPADGPYARYAELPAPAPPRVSDDPADIAAATELADAERARARHAATPEQADRLVAVDQHRSAAARRRAWRRSGL